MHYALDQAQGQFWALYQGDCIEVMKGMPANSVHLSVYSPPFANLYIYGDSAADMGNSSGYDEFFDHFAYLVPELWRVTVPGRICVVHCKDLPQYANRDGAFGISAFPDALLRCFESFEAEDGGRWQYHSRVTIWKDPVDEMLKTNNHGLLHKNFTERAEVCRQGLPDYLIVLRKVTADVEDKQVQHRREPGDYIGTKPPVGYRNQRDYSIQVWQRYASPVWFDIDPMDTLNYRIAKDSADEKHICPLQLGVIRRCIDIWTNKGEVVFSPFAGIGSEVVCAVEMGRKAVGIELKRSYFNLAVKYLRQAEVQSLRPTLFDLDEFKTGVA